MDRQLYRAYLLDRDTGTQYDLGIVDAPDHVMAREAAGKKYKNLVGKLQTGKVELLAEPYHGPAPAKGKRKRSRNLAAALI